MRSASFPVVDPTVRPSSPVTVNFEPALGQLECPKEPRFGSTATTVVRLARRRDWRLKSGTGPAAVRTYGPGDEVENYVLKAPNGLTVRANSKTYEDPRMLSELLQPNMGVCHWAACTNVR
jgi:hypothetical protein